MNDATEPFPDVSFRPSLLANLGKVIFSLVAVILGLPLAHLISESIGRNYTLEIWASFCVIGVFAFSKAAFKAYNQRMCLCHEYVSSYSGMLGPNLRTTRLLYEHVRGVEIDQSILQRCFNLGDLHIGSDVNKGEGEMLICGIRNPDKLKDLLLERVRLSAHSSEQKQAV